ncbi:LysR substrate-binding domain-containing protein [Enterovirga aerilata]|uniref:LysR family transcriptional regulator n=1 Tax=Enterovirga aerilata TaxID=2730920 RepID=A0A849IJN8_9HYPH|nr:LysR substrate-binding domain-containing protein [Enterovirga sp. DB1703]NNM74153.1 LysR family transcriptional regulator [Enterovirga sp. DB1703]
MSHDVTPLNPLRVFEVAARLGSFTRAAQELSVTQPAISRQIATLENYLRVRLFMRGRQQVALTPEGERYYEQVAPALAAIAAASSDLRAREQEQPLRVRVYPTFAAKWLIPRMGSLSAAHPRLKIKLISAVAPVNFGRDDVDVAIQLGRHEGPGIRCQHLFTDVLQPVCSPELLKRGPPLDRVSDLAAHRLLHSKYRMTDWAYWLEANGYSGPAMADGMTFPSSVLTYQAAMEGLGVAIGQVALLEAECRSGRLVPLFTPVKRDLAYQALWPSSEASKRGLRTFLSWLKSEAAKSPALSAAGGAATP